MEFAPIIIKVWQSTFHSQSTTLSFPFFNMKFLQPGFPKVKESLRRKKLLFQQRINRKNNPEHKYKDQNSIIV